MNAQVIPHGYRKNAAGHLVPEESISGLELARDELVTGIAGQAKSLQVSMRGWKRKSMEDIYAFLDLMAEKYGAKMGGAKGNISLRSFDGRYRVEINTSDFLTFGEQIHAAKVLIDACIHKWTKDSGVEIQALVEHAFQVDKRGRFNVGRILTLTRLEFDDPDWQAAMQAIKDAMQVVTSKSYIRVYERIGSSDKYEQINLDMAVL